MKNWLIRKDPGAGKHWRQEEKGMIEDEMVGWHHQLDGDEFEQAPGVGDRQGSLGCCSPWGCRESDTTWATELNLDVMRRIFICDFIPHSRLLWGEKGVITRAGLLNTEGGSLNTLGTICKRRFLLCWLLVVLVTLHPAVVLSPLAHAYWTTEQRYATCLTHFGTSISHFTVSVSLWGLKRFSYLLYVGARKKVSLYSWNLWKRYCKNRKWLESDRNFCATNIRTLSRINLLFIKIKFMFYRCMSAYNFFAHHIQFLWS